LMVNVLVWREKQPPWPEAPPGPGTEVLD
jgi:hypothetical protein